MCGRFTYLSYDELNEAVEAVASGTTMRLHPVASRSQARPGSPVQAITPDERECGPELEIVSLTWGFDAPFGKGLVFNTRIESALDGSRMWRDALREGRCIMPVASFFEPHLSETTRSPRTGRPAKRQYEFRDAQGAPLLLAGVQQNGRLSIVTAEPNASVAPIHARMPLVLRFEEAPQWLEGNILPFADRSRIELEAHPEDEGDVQMSLF